VLRLFDAPLYRDWLFWFMVVWVAIGFVSVMTSDRPSGGPRWLNAVLSALLFAVLAGLIPGWIRLRIRRHRWNKRQHVLTRQQESPQAKVDAELSRQRPDEREPRRSDPLAETVTGLGVTAADPTLVGIKKVEAPPETISSLTWSQVHWDRINADEFERLLTRLLSESGSYVRITRLMNINAPDAGRDIQAYRRVADGLVSERLERVLVQAKHWPRRGIGSSDIADLVHAKLPLWEGEPVRGLIVATTGSFTQDAVRWVDNHNSAATRPEIVLWSSSELETLLRKWPPLAHEFGLVD
jgi:restriction endonuclease